MDSRPEETVVTSPEPAGRTERPGALELIERTLDPGSWRSWDAPAIDLGPIDDAYAADLAAARERTGACREPRAYGARPRA